MIISKIQGGLGNQIFQWAYGKFLSTKNKTNLHLDLSFFTNQYGNTNRNFELNLFPKIDLPKSDITKKPFVYINDNFQFKNLNYDDQYNYYLNGFWQSEKYFIEVSDLIKDQLSPTEDQLITLKKNINPNSVSLHIRRSDYLTSNGFHPVQTLEYYKNAINKIGKYENLYVFSDDIDWCKNNLEFKNIVFVEGKTNIEDLWLMSLCDHNIIANSSFSWWGAWLNNNPNKMVIAPKLWFGQHVNINSGDIVPDEWIKL